MSSANATSPPHHHNHNGSDGTAVGIRVPAGPDPMFDREVTSQSDVWRMIEEAKRRQAKFRGDVDLFPRRWRKTMTTTSPTARRTTRSGDGSGSSPAAAAFTAMQFNTLAEGLSSGPADVKTPFPPSSDADGASWLKNDYGGFTPSVPNPEVCLDFELRRWRILEVVLSSYPAGEGDEGDVSAPALGPGPDLLAMEEVDHFADFFLPALRLFGYSSCGLFHPKKASPSAKIGWYSDGVALLWKEGTFDLLSCRTGGFTAAPAGGASNQGYVIASLRHKRTGRVIVAAATHLKSKPGVKNEATRTAQAKELLEVVASEVLAVATTHGGDAVDPAVIVMGDFNAEPPHVPGSTCVPALLSGRLLALRSAYPEVAEGLGGRSRHFYTTWKTRGNGPTVRRVIDYVLHGCLASRSPPLLAGDGDGDGDGGGVGGETMAGMRCTRVLDVPDAVDVDSGGCGGLIGFRYPSDHAMIAARFEFVIVADHDNRGDVEEVKN